ncbi:hypothetical protein predicted by Glimmer/Critica [Sorangium cellulosum So ce56]|uniref:Uncharacterized protein n=1 Tax=Sorangium cellulosum (strain So ce56) TaxID=448385 RepID=A9EU96_SORC5|nr:hypothetical protein predicted by Glimmer/Critica [Sorangium cellulosum So ce56]
MEHYRPSPLLGHAGCTTDRDPTFARQGLDDHPSGGGDGNLLRRRAARCQLLPGARRRARAERGAPATPLQAARQRADRCAHRDGLRSAARRAARWTVALADDEVERRKIVSRECLGRNRIPTLAALGARVQQRNAAADRARRKIDWTFTVRDAERIFGSDWFNRIVAKH